MNARRLAVPLVLAVLLTGCSHDKAKTRPTDTSSPNVSNCANVGAYPQLTRSTSDGPLVVTCVPSTSATP